MPRSVLASRALAVLAVGVVAILASLQAINTEAGGDDDPMLRELSQKVARVAAAGGGAIVTSSGTYQLQSPVTSESSLSSQPVSTSGDTATGASPDGQVAVEVAAASPTPEPSPVQAVSAAGAVCPPDPEGGPFCLYTVQDGDTLWGIADQLGFEGNQHFSGAELLAMSNGLNNAQNWLIVPAQELRVPSATGVVHTVDEAQTISQLAELYGSTTEEVSVANPALNPNNVIAGSEVLIPSPSLWPVFGPVVVEDTEDDIDTEDAQDEAGSEEPSDGTDGEPDDVSEDEEPQSEAQPTGEGDAEGEEPAEGDGADGEAADDAAEAAEGDGPAEEANTEEDTAEDGEGDREAEMEPPSRSSGAANPSVTEIKDQFAAGYIAAGGPAQYLERILAKVIPCESGYNLRAYNPAGPFYGLMQFLPETWVRVGGGDWADAWQQGHNTGRLLLQSSPTSQWPHCWR